MLVDTYISFLDLIKLTSSVKDISVEMYIETIKLRTQFSLIYENSMFITDESRDTILAHSKNPYINNLIKKNKIESNKNQFEELRNKKPTFFKGDRVKPQIFILTSFPEDHLKALQSESGCIFLKNLADLKKLNFFQSVYFTTKQQMDWTQVTNIIGPHNSILIEDPYILFDEVSISNCIKFFQKTAPKTIRTDYHITIISKSKNRNIIGYEDKLQQSTETLRSGILNVLPKAQLEILFCDTSDFHDRSIITNNCFVFCGLGFGIANSDNYVSKHTTWISCGLFNPLEVNSETKIGLFNLQFHLKRIRFMLNTLNQESKNQIFRVCY